MFYCDVMSSTLSKFDLFLKSRILHLWRCQREIRSNARGMLVLSAEVVRAG